MNPKFFTILRLFILINLTSKISSTSINCLFHNLSIPIGRFSSMQGYGCDIQGLTSDEAPIIFTGTHEYDETDKNITLIKYQIYDEYRLPKLDSSICQKFPNIENIFISQLEIQSIDENSLKTCKNLNKLYFYENRIREFPENLLAKSLNLTILNVDFNELTELPENFLKNQRKLEELGMTNNQINFLPSNIFKSLKNLKILRMGRNKISAIDRKWFKNLVNLVILGLEENEITQIPNYSFKFLSNLDDLSLNNNKIKLITSNTFRGLKSLKTLNLDRNKISDLPKNAFNDSRSLEELNIAHNDLSSIYSDSFGTLTNFKKLHCHINAIEAIDEEFIDKTAIIDFDLTENICSDEWFLNRDVMKKNLTECFENYQPRMEDDEDVEEEEGELETENEEDTTLIFGEDFIPTTPLESSTSPETTQSSTSTTTEATTTTISLTEPPTTLTTTTSTKKPVPITTTSTEKPTTTTSTEKPTTTTKISTSTENPTTTTTTSLLTILTTSTTEIPIEVSVKENILKLSIRSGLERPVDELTNCGKPKVGLPTIVKGTAIVPGSFPWNAALLRTNGEFFCGGTLVSNNKVVTAAHCLKGKYGSHIFTPGDILVSLGSHDLSKGYEIGRITAAVKTISNHPDWNPNIASFDADISVLELAEPVRFTNHIQPICMIQPGSEVESIKNGIVAGFGKSEFNKVENIARVIDIPMYTYHECSKSRDHESLLSHRTFCGGHANGTGVCVGDSGGGLIVSYQNIYYLRGIVSASLHGNLYGCNVNAYAVFTDVMQFREWIETGLSHKDSNPAEILERFMKIVGISSLGELNNPEIMKKLENFSKKTT